MHSLAAFKPHIATLLVLQSAFSFSLAQGADSAYISILKLPDDTAKLIQLYDFAFEVEQTDLERSLEINRVAAQIAQRLDAPRWQSLFAVEIGRAHANMGNLDSAMVYFEIAEEGFRALGDQKGLAAVYGKKQWVYNYKADYAKSLSFAFKALDIYQKLGDEEGAALAKVDIAYDLQEQEKYEEALPYAESAHQYIKERGQQADLAVTAQALGDVLLDLGRYEEALRYMDESLAVRQSLGYDIDIALSYNARANVLKYMERYKEALDDYQAGLALAEEIGFDPLVQSCVGNIGDTYSRLGQYEKALQYHLRNHRLLKTVEKTRDLAENVWRLAESYAKTGQMDSAYYYQLQYSEVRDSLLSEEINQQTSELQVRFETAQREATIAEQQSQLTRQRQFLWGAVAFLSLVLIGGGLLWRLNQKLQERNREKELLIKEVHHRVKNNLQVLSSLLFLQSKHLKDDAALNAIKEGQNRVESMGLIHQKLYTEGSLTSIDMPEYLRQLGDNLLDSFGLDEKQVYLRYQVAPLQLDVDTAVPLGLICNELLTNTLKYAFRKQAHGEVLIRLEERPTGLLLQIADNGGGSQIVPASERGTSFGESLVKLLSKKLKGKITVDDSAEGYSTTILFESYRKRRAVN